MPSTITNYVLVVSSWFKMSVKREASLSPDSRRLADAAPSDIELCHYFHALKAAADAVELAEQSAAASSFLNEPSDASSEYSISAAVVKQELEDAPDAEHSAAPSTPVLKAEPSHAVVKEELVEDASVPDAAASDPAAPAVTAPSASDWMHDVAYQFLSDYDDLVQVDHWECQPDADAAETQSHVSDCSDDVPAVSTHAPDVETQDHNVLTIWCPEQPVIKGDLLLNIVARIRERGTITAYNVINGWLWVKMATEKQARRCEKRLNGINVLQHTCTIVCQLTRIGDWPPGFVPDATTQPGVAIPPHHQRHRAGQKLKGGVRHARSSYASPTSHWNATSSTSSWRASQTASSSSCGASWDSAGRWDSGWGNSASSSGWTSSTIPPLPPPAPGPVAIIGLGPKPPKTRPQEVNDLSN